MPKSICAIKTRTSPANAPSPTAKRIAVDTFGACPSKVGQLLTAVTCLAIYGLPNDTKRLPKDLNARRRSSALPVSLLFCRGTGRPHR